MITVRFASGFSIRYNTANYATHGDAYTHLYEKDGGRWIAQVPTSACVIEVQPAGKTFDAMHDTGEALDSVLQAIRNRALGNSYSGAAKLADLKRVLVDFDGRRRRWK